MKTMVGFLLMVLMGSSALALQVPDCEAARQNDLAKMTALFQLKSAQFDLLKRLMNLNDEMYEIRLKIAEKKISKSLANEELDKIRSANVELQQENTEVLDVAKCILK